MLNVKVIMAKVLSEVRVILDLKLSVLNASFNQFDGANFCTNQAKGGAHVFRKSA